jgi:integrase
MVDFDLLPHFFHTETTKQQKGDLFMASIRKRGDYQWEVQIRKKGFPHQSKTFNTRAEADLWAKTIESEMGRGVFEDRSEAEATTLYEALDRYSKEITPKKDGAAQEMTRIKVWKRHHLAKRSLASLRGADFARYRDERMNDVKPSTIQKELALLSHLFTIARKEWGLSVTNPISNISMPREDNSRDRRFIGNEEVRLLNALLLPKGKGSNIWLLPMVQFAIETAGRQSELLALKWSDVDLNRGVARFRGKERQDGGSRTKNKDKYRDVPLSSKARAILNGMPRSMGDCVFPTTESAVRQSFIRACMRAKIEDFHFHDLRHEATSRLAEKLPMHTLMKVTGHKDTRMLARYYHPEMEKIAAVLG